MLRSLSLVLLLACAQEPAPAKPDACTLMSAPAPGPLEAERAKAGNNALALAKLRIQEARRTGDPGFYTLADTALACALERKPDDLEAARLRAHVALQFHRFAEVEAEAKEMVAKHGDWLDYALLGDAQMEQGKLDAAANSYQKAADLRPGLELYDRIAWLRWLWGDVEGSIEMQQQAVAVGTPQDPEPFAWVLTRLGWLHAITGAPSPEIDAALRLLPDYPPAHFARGRIRLAAGDYGNAIADLQAVGPTVEATRAKGEAELGLDPGKAPSVVAAVKAVGSQDPRGYALWLADRDPDMALPLIEDEWKIRQDAMTRVIRAYVRYRLGQPSAADEARAALGTGIADPRALLLGGVVLHDQATIARALAGGPGLLPSERALASRP